MNQQQHPSRLPHIYKLIGITFIITQTIIMLFGLSLSFLWITLGFIFNVFSTIYQGIKEYHLTVFVLLILFICHKFKVRIDKLLGNILENILQRHFKCCVCKLAECDLNCKGCKMAYHQGCATADQICSNPDCKQKLYKQKPQNLYQFAKDNKKIAFYIIMLFVVIGMYPSMHSAYQYILSLTIQSHQSDI